MLLTLWLLGLGCNEPTGETGALPDLDNTGAPEAFFADGQSLWRLEVETGALTDLGADASGARRLLLSPARLHLAAELDDEVVVLSAQDGAEVLRVSGELVAWRDDTSLIRVRHDCPTHGEELWLECLPGSGCEPEDKGFIGEADALISTRFARSPDGGRVAVNAQIDPQPYLFLVDLQPEWWGMPAGNVQLPEGLGQCRPSHLTGGHITCVDGEHMWVTDRFANARTTHELDFAPLGDPMPGREGAALVAVGAGAGPCPSGDAPCLVEVDLASGAPAVIEGFTDLPAIHRDAVQTSSDGETLLLAAGEDLYLATSDGETMRHVAATQGEVSVLAW